MGRIRTVKPEFFQHEKLYAAESETGLPLRLAFIGLWTQCDREGRFEWRPARLKLNILPWDDADFSRVLDALCTRGFVVRYAVNEQEIGAIPSWRKHQVINNRERDSELPERPVNKKLRTRAPRVATRGQDCKGEGKGKGKGNGIDPPCSPPDGGPPPCPIQDIVQSYHEALPASPHIRVLTPTVEKALRVRWREEPERQSVEWWAEFFGYVATQCPFLVGQTHASDRPPFVADLGWLVKPSNFAKVVNGNYERRRNVS